MADAAPPLTWETSTDTRPLVSQSLPEPVVSCLQNARFLHLATCTNLQPHVSLMNYTYLPSNSFTNSTTALPSGPVIIMTTNPSSRKTLNLVSNPNVSLLVHDWVSARPPNSNSARPASPEGRRNAGRSSLAALLMGMNASAMGSISATINGTAMVLEKGCEEEKWCKERHLANNTFEDQEGGASAQGMEQGFFSGSPAAAGGDGGIETFIRDEDVRVVVVRIQEGRIADWKGRVSDWVLAEPAEQGLTNGV